MRSDLKLHSLARICFQLITELFPSKEAKSSHCDREETQLAAPPGLQSSHIEWLTCTKKKSEKVKQVNAGPVTKGIYTMSSLCETHTLSSGHLGSFSLGVVDGVIVRLQLEQSGLACWEGLLTYRQQQGQGSRPREPLSRRVVCGPVFSCRL